MKVDDFITIQMDFLYHKYLRHTVETPVISDEEFETMERKSLEAAEELGFRADKSLGAEDNESHHVHWMVGFSEDSPYWNSTKTKYQLE